jgi:hypothetical protein
VAPAKAIYEAQLLQRRACHLGLQTTITVKNGKKRMAWWAPPSDEIPCEPSPGPSRRC